MDVSEQDVVEVLRGSRALVVLDARRRPEVARQVEALLEGSPDLRVIVVSGAELGVEGESTFVLPEAQTALPKGKGQQAALEAPPQEL
jgi:hypothetical protein